MNTIALCCGLLAMSAPAPKWLTVEVRVCKGDPLAASDAVRNLSNSTIATQPGKPAFARAGGEVPVAAAGNKVEYMFLGTEIEVVPLARANGSVWTEVNLRHVTQSPALGIQTKDGPVPGYTEQTVRHTRESKLGHTNRYRIAVNAPDDQVWVEITVRAAGATNP